MELRPYEPDDHARLVEFLKVAWAPSHAVYDRRLFDWQYRVDTHPGASMLAVEEGRVVGFLGGIPGQVVAADGRRTASAAWAMWAVSHDLRSSGLGVMLMRHVERRFPATYTLGIGLPVVPLYERMGYGVLPALVRFVAPLKSSGYAELLEQPPTVAATDAVEAWAAQLHAVEAGANGLRRRGVEAAAELARASLSPGGAVPWRVLRDEEFYRWRYFDSPGFIYHVLSAEGGLAIVRLEEVRTGAGAPVLSVVARLLELWPADDAGPGRDEGLSSLLGGVTAWARAQGAVAIDFQSSTGLWSDAFIAAGWRVQGAPEETRLVQLFAPLRRGAAPINAGWRPRGDGRTPLLLKSDADMDRPVLWPPPTA
jgi:hypothetical protein